MTSRTFIAPDFSRGLAIDPSDDRQLGFVSTTPVDDRILTPAPEYIPYPFLQLRRLVRFRDGPPQIAGSRDNQLELEAHIFF
jgi:hypothetical protein